MLKAGHMTRSDWKWP